MTAGKPKGKPRGRPFAKGRSGNPAGRPKEVVEVRDLARQHTEAAIDRLVFWMASDHPKASPAAATALLNRGWGAPAQAVTGEGGEGPVRIIVETGVERSAD